MITMPVPLTHVTLNLVARMSLWTALMLTCVLLSTVIQPLAANILLLFVSLIVRVILHLVFRQKDVMKQLFHVMIVMHAQLMDVTVFLDAGTRL
jgi:hypothetical protein